MYVCWNQVVRMNLKFVTKTYVMGGPFGFKGRKPMEWVILKKYLSYKHIYTKKFMQPTTAEKKTDARLISQKSMTHEKNILKSLLHERKAL